MPLVIRFCVQPGYVRSQSDGDVHYITVGQLVKLYGAAPAECTTIQHTKFARSRRPCKDLHHLYPSRTGNYFNVHEEYGPPTEWS